MERCPEGTSQAILSSHASRLELKDVRMARDGLFDGQNAILGCAKIPASIKTQ